jgi:hypothetical protein
VVTPVATGQKTAEPQQEPQAGAGHTGSQSTQAATRHLWASGTTMPIAQRRHSGSGSGGRKHRTTVNPGKAKKADPTKPLSAPTPPYASAHPNEGAKRPSKTIQQLRLKQAQLAYAQPHTRAQYRLCTGIKRPLNTPNGPNTNATSNAQQQMVAVGTAPGNARAKMDGEGAGGKQQRAQQTLPSSLQQQQNGALLKPGVIRPLAPPSMQRGGGAKPAKRPATNVNAPTQAGTNVRY